MHPKYARLVQRSKEPQKSKIQHKRLFLFKPKLFRRALGILILIVAVSWSFQYWIPSSKAYATPWSPTHGSYAQRKQLTLVNNSGQTFESGSTYKVSIDTASLYNTGSLLSSCDDLRVVYQPSNTTAVELKRAVEYASSSSGVTTCGTSSATKVVFQLQADMSNGSNTSYYYLYYDNPQATAYSSSDALDAYNVGAKEATFVAPFNGTTTALAAGSGTPTTATGAIRYSGGKSALRFKPVADSAVNIPSTDMNPSQNSVTIEYWINFNNISNTLSPSVDIGGVTTGYGGGFRGSIYRANSTPNKLTFTDTVISGMTTCTSNTNLTANQWIHVALVYTKNDNKGTLYQNGNQVAQCNVNYVTDGWLIYSVGAYVPQSGHNYYNEDALIDEVRISNTARYTTNFTPSTTPFVRDEYTKLLLHFDENGDDPRNTGKAIDDSGNGNHGTITGAKYVGGLIGVDGSSSNTSYQSNMSNQSYGSHEGVFIEEGTTNKITNPSFDHPSTYAQGWASPTVFDYDSSADTFTAGMAKRNSAGPFASGVMVQGKPTDYTEIYDTLSYSRDTQIGGQFYKNIDGSQGSVVLWYTPEENTSSQYYQLWDASPVNPSQLSLFTQSGYLKFALGTQNYTGPAINLLAGTTYNIVVSWDTKNKIDGTNYVRFSINDTHTFAGTVLGGSYGDTYSSTSICNSGTYWSNTCNGIIEGLTIYRRPLFDGTYGIDVGNGDEIAKIYDSDLNNGNGITSQDPTLVTGSWDVVFALPTNASTGALTTGTGNAWSHPHASNLLYTSTTNTGGFMMNGTPATDGWSEIPWYKVGGASGVVAAYQPIGATDLANSYVNKANPGTYNAAPGVAPTWDATNGWIFGGTAAYLNTGIVPSSFDWSMIVQFSGATENPHSIIGAYQSDTQAFLISTRQGGMHYLIYNGTYTFEPTYPFYSSGNLSVAGFQTYINGSSAATVANPGGTVTTSAIKVGYISPFIPFSGNVQAAAIYSSTLNATQVANVTDAMEALSSSGTYLTPTALATGEKIFAGGYKFTSNGANQGISRSFTATNGGDYVLRAMGHSDGTCSPQIKITRADGTTEITHLNGTTTSTRTAPNVYVFTWESPAAEDEQVQLINTASSGTCYWHQVEVLSNLINNPSMETGAGDPWIPTGWSNYLLDAGESVGDTSVFHSGLTSYKESASRDWNEFLEQNITSLTAGKYYDFGFFSKTTTGAPGIRMDSSYATLLPQTLVDSDYINYLAGNTSGSWGLSKEVNRLRAGRTSENITVGFGASGVNNYDDTYMVNLTDVTLTVTPATEANSLETTGLRVDGTDTLTQPITDITSASGTIKFKVTPRHNFVDATKFGNTGYCLFQMYYGTYNSVSLCGDASSLGVSGVFNGTPKSASWSSPTLNAGTTYEMAITYVMGGSLSLKVNGVQVATVSGVDANYGLRDIPTTAYFGSNYLGLAQYDATFAAPDFTGTVTPTENTTAPYYKFGTKSLKLVASADGRYVTSINPGNVNTHTLSAYVYDGTSGNVGGTVSATVAKMIFNGSVVTPASYTDVGGGWWRLTYSAATANAAGDYGIAILSGKTIYVDGVQLEEKYHATSYTDGSLGSGYSWSGTTNDSTSVRLAGDLSYSATNNITSASGSINFWFKVPYVSSVTGHGWNIYPTLFSTKNSFFGDPVLAFESWGGSNFVTTFGNATNWTGLAATSGNWYNYTITWNGRTATTYFNGASPLTIISTVDVSFDALNMVKGFNSTGNASLSDFKTYSTELTSTEVADLYYSGLGSHSSLAPVATERYTDGEPPVLAWHLNEGYGTTAYDTTIYTNSGTISGATWSDDSVILSGSEGSRSLKFDGVDDKISRTYANDPELNPGTSPFSVSTWFKHPSTVTGTDTLISRYSSTGSGGGYKVYMNSSGFICFGVDDDTTWGPDDSACTTVSYADSNWHHVLAIKGTSTIAVYIDGTQKASTTFTVSSSLNGNTPTFYVGIDSDGTSNPWDGFIDEVRVYNSARSEEQINQEYIAKGTNKGVSAQFGSGGASDTLTKGLVGHWKMDEASWNGTAGEVLDASGNGNNGTSVNGATTATGKFGNGGTFDGTNDYVNLGNNSVCNFAYNSSFAISLWINPTNFSAFRYFIAKHDGSYVGVSWGYSTNSNSIEYTLRGSGNGNTHIRWSALPTTGVWTNVVLVSNGSKVSGTDMYYNGVKQTKGYTVDTLTSSTTNSNECHIGAETAYSGSYMLGNMDDFRIYNRALSPVEVRALYEYAPGPVAHWTMDEGSGQSAYDKSGNSNTGTLGASSSVGSDDPTWTNGKYGKALSFDGGDDKASVTGTIPNTSTNNGLYSVGAWVKPSSVSSGQHSVFTSGNGTNGYSFKIYRVGSNWGIAQSPGDTSTSDTNGVIPGQWTYLEGVWDGSNIKLYANGILKGTSTSITTRERAGINHYFGYDGNEPSSPFEYFDGLIDDVRIYNYARTQKQIVSDMNAGHPAVGSPVGSAVAHYKFDEGQGTVAQNSGNGGSTLNGTLTNMSAPATSTSGWTNDGKFGKAVNFDRSNDYVIAGSTINLSSALTFSTWAKTSMNDANQMPLVSNLNAGVRSGPLFAMLNGKFTYHNGSVFCTTTNLTYSDNNWHNAILVIDGNTQKIYVDGKLDGSSACTYNQNSTDRLLIGSTYSNSIPANSWFSGSIDEVKIYNYALSEDEVKLEYNAGKAIVMGNLGTTTDGKTASNSQSRAYCPPGNVEGNCAAGQNPAPVAEWNFDEGSGTSATDTSGNNNTGSLTNGPTWTNGKSGKGLSFDGVDDYVDAGNNSILNSNYVTVEAWVKPSGTGQRCFYSRWNNPDGNMAILCTDGTGLTGGNSNKPFFRIGTPSDSNLSGNTTLLNNIWYHVVGSYDGSKMKIYINGVEDATKDATGNLSSSSNTTTIGKYHVVRQRGSIDQVRIYNYARTPAQIAWDYNQGLPAVHYKFNECTGTTINNSVPNANEEESGNNGTLTIGASGTQTSAGTCSSGVATSAWTNGKSGAFNTGMSLDGTDDYITTGDTNININSVSVWVRPASTSQSIIDLDGGTHTITVASGAIAANGFATPTIYVDGKVSTTLPNTDWHMITVTSATAFEASNLVLGKIASSFFSGRLDEFKMFTYPLTREQVKLQYNDASAVKFKAEDTEKWWLAGGVAPASAVAVYQPKGAASLADSYSNLANPGTYDAAPGVAPTWNATSGWTTDGSAYLYTGLTNHTSQNRTIIAKFSNYSTTSAGYRGVAGFYSAVQRGLYLTPAQAGSSFFFNGGNTQGTSVTSGVMAVAGQQGYLNGNSVGSISSTWEGSSNLNLTLLAINYLGTDIFGRPHSLQAIAIYNTTLTADQVAKITAKMQGL